MKNYPESFRKFSVGLIVCLSVLMGCGEKTKANQEANEFGKDSIIVSKEFSENGTFDRDEFGLPMRVRQDLSGYVFIMKDMDHLSKDSGNIIGKILCGKFIYCKTIRSSSNRSQTVGYEIVLMDKNSRRGIGFLPYKDVISPADFQRDSFCRAVAKIKSPNDTDCDLRLIKLTGIYTGKNLLVLNPYNCDGIGYCTYEVRVNDYITTDLIGKLKFEISLNELQRFKEGDPIEVKIFHKDCCNPVVLNPEVLGKEYNISSE